MSRDPVRPGEIRLAALRPDPPAAARGPSRTLRVTNASRHAVRISSHFPLECVNRRLRFDRAAAAGHRLDLPAGSTVRFAPGETRDVAIVALRRDAAAEAAAETPTEGGRGAEPARS